jgi:hypothetical protein
LKTLTDFCSSVPLIPLAIELGFRQRKAKKLTPLLFVQATVLLVSQSAVSLRRWAILTGVLGGLTLSKQALWGRLGEPAVAFLQHVLALALRWRAVVAAEKLPEALRRFKRVLVQDSTTVALIAKLAKLFPGGSNQHGTQGGQLRIQAIVDLVSQRFVYFGLSSFRRNDQAAAFDVLDVVQAGDLVVRDLGYFVLGSLQKIRQAGAFFLSRLRVSTGLWDAQGKKALDLLKLLRTQERVDLHVCLGASKVPVRLVAVKLPPAVAAERRRRARAGQKHDGRYQLQKRTLALLGWAIFVTNVPATEWSTPTVVAVYGLRWRIETIFKAWKSHFRLTEVPKGSATQLKAMIYGRLIFLTLWAQVCGQNWLLMETGQRSSPPHSLLKIASLVGDFFLVLCLEAWGVRITPAWLKQLFYHTRYENHRRKSFPRQFAFLS